MRFPSYVTDLRQCVVALVFGIIVLHVSLRSYWGDFNIEHFLDIDWCPFMDRFIYFYS